MIVTVDQTLAGNMYVYVCITIRAVVKINRFIMTNFK